MPIVTSPEEVQGAPRPEAMPAGPTRRPVTGGRWRRVVRGELTLDDLWLAAFPVACLFLAAAEQIAPNDFWWHLRTGQMIVQKGVIPTTDLLTFTRAGQPWTNQSWLAQAIFYLLYRAGNLPLLLFAYALAMAAGYASVEAACLRRTAGLTRPAVLGTMAAIALGLVTWGVRPQAASFLGFGLLTWLLAEHHAGRRRVIWLLPPLFLAWVNLHGGFVFGLGLLAVYASAEVAGELRAAGRLSPPGRSLMAATGLSAALLSLNPSGPLGMIQYVGGFFRSQATLELNLEFAPLSAREPAGLLFVALTLVLLVLLYRHRGGLPAYDVAALLVFGGLTLYSIRVIPWYGMVLAPALSRLLALEPRIAAASPGKRRERRRLNSLVALLLALSCVLALPWLRPLLLQRADQQSYYTPHTTPVQATEALCRLGAQTRAFSEIGYASYQAWACPQVPVFMDTRFELYPMAMWQDYLRITFARFGWEEALARYGVNAVMASKSAQSALIDALRASQSWQLVYEDADSAVFRTTNHR